VITLYIIIVQLLSLLAIVRFQALDRHSEPMTFHELANLAVDPIPIEDKLSAFFLSDA
jgi:hypothetical protein